jgi:hypothetical protein
MPSLFYQLLLGELTSAAPEPAAGLRADPGCRAQDGRCHPVPTRGRTGLQGRNGDAALQAARAWKQAFPQSREANRYVLQILVTLNRIPESAEPLKTEISLADPKERPAVIGAIARSYSRVTDKKQAATVVEQALADYLNAPDTGAAAWSAVGRLRLAAGDTAGAMDAARRGQAISPASEGPVLLALELMDPKLPQAEALVRTYLQGKPLAEMRMAMRAHCSTRSGSPKPLQQLQMVTRERPDLAEAWLAQGTLLPRTTSCRPPRPRPKYLELAQAQPRARTQPRAWPRPT